MAIQWTISSAEVKAGVEKLLGAEPEPPSVMFDHIYAEPSAELARQREAGLSAIAAEREANMAKPDTADSTAPSSSDAPLPPLDFREAGPFFIRSAVGMMLVLGQTPASKS